MGHAVGTGAVAAKAAPWIASVTRSGEVRYEGFIAALENTLGVVAMGYGGTLFVGGLVSGRPFRLIEARPQGALIACREVRFEIGGVAAAVATSDGTIWLADRHDAATRVRVVSH